MSAVISIETDDKDYEWSDVPASHSGEPRTWLELLKQRPKAKRITIVPPEAVPADQAAREQAWLDEIGPRDLIEREVITRVAVQACALDRAERAERTLLAIRAREAATQRAEEAERLGHLLLYGPPPPQAASNRSTPPAPPVDLPAVPLRRLEATAEGCQWLLDRWFELATVIEHRCLLSDADTYRFIRLLGKDPLDAAYDKEVNAFLMAWESAELDHGKTFYDCCLAKVPPYDRAFRAQQPWRELGPRPANQDECTKVVLGLLSKRTRQLQNRLAEHEAMAAVTAATGAAAMGAPDPEHGLERLQKLQATSARELRQTLDLLRKLRNAKPRPVEETGDQPAPQSPLHVP